VPLAALPLWDGYGIALGSRGANLGDTLASLGAEVMMPRRLVRGGQALYAVAMVAGYALHLIVDFHAPARLQWGRLL
jgi:hypothetical protein